MSFVRLAPEEAAFYSSQSVFSDPGEFAARYEDLPPDPAGLARVVRDLLVNRVEGGRFGIDLAPDRMRDDAETRYVDGILRLITARDGAPLARRRDFGDRFVAICRDFTLLHVSMLRYAGVPARMRVGFTDYFGTDGFHGDHVVTEYWDEARGRWVLAASPYDVPFAAARTLFTTHDGLRTPPRALSLAPFNGPVEVTLR